MRILVVLGEGGHTRQMIRLLDELGAGYEYHYLMAVEDELSESKIRVPGPVWRIGRPRNKVQGRTDSPALSAWQTAASLAQLLQVMGNVEAARQYADMALQFAPEAERAAIEQLIQSLGG